MRKSILALLALALVLALGGAAFAAKDTLVVADQYDATMFDPIRHNDYIIGVVSATKECKFLTSSSIAFLNLALPCEMIFPKGILAK